MEEDPSVVPLMLYLKMVFDVFYAINWVRYSRITVNTGITDLIIDEILRSAT